MYYIFNKNGECICSCSGKPDKEDLATRKEIAVESEATYETQDIILAGGEIIPRPPCLPTAEDKVNQLAVQYADKITELKDVLATATLAGDDETVAELRNEYADLMAEYQAALEVIGNDEAL